MGDNTNYDLTGGENHGLDVKKMVAERLQYDPFEDSCKWYGHEEDMKELSATMPDDVVLCLSGEGEEAGDIWKKYFKGGKMQVCHAELVFPEYDESKLE